MPFRGQPAAVRFVHPEAFERWEDPTILHIEHQFVAAGSLMRASFRLVENQPNNWYSGRIKAEGMPNVTELKMGIPVDWLMWFIDEANNWHVGVNCASAPRFSTGHLQLEPHEAGVTRLRIATRRPKKLRERSHADAGRREVCLFCLFGTG